MQLQRICGCLKPLHRQYATSHSRAAPLNILFFGRETFSCDTLKVLYAAKAPLKLLAQSLGIPVIEVPTDNKEFAQWVPKSFDKIEHDNALVTASFGRAIPIGLLGLFDPSLRLNVHPSLLPKYRGAAPIQRTIIAGELRTGVSILQMDDVALHGFDAGPIWDQREVVSNAYPLALQTYGDMQEIPAKPIYASLESLLAWEGGRLLVDFLRRRAAGEAHSVAQEHSKATKARMITTETARVQWTQWDAYTVERIHRAIGHQRALHTVLASGLNLKLLDVQLADLGGYSMLKHPGDATYDPRLQALVIRCAEGSFVAVARLQTESRKEAAAHEWWNGVRPELLHSRVLRLGTAEAQD